MHDGSDECRTNFIQRGKNEVDTGTFPTAGRRAVAYEESLTNIPDELSSVEAAPLMCAGETTFSALRNSKARPGDLVAIQGIGGIGHLAVQYAHKAGFRTVAISRGSDKEERIRQLGAHHYINSDKEDPARVSNWDFRQVIS